MGIKVEDLYKDFGHKQKSIKDLAQFIKIRTGKVPNYNVLLGAGCSVTSGVRSGQDLVQIWKKELFIQSYENNKINNDASTNCYEEVYRSLIEDREKIDFAKITEYFQSNYAGDWYYSNKEYSSLFERKFDLPRQRRAFVEREVRNASPSLGYAYLVSLIEESYFNTIFTTNFDDLINEAFYQYSSDERPIICAHDSAISSITVTSPRPKIIKLHGDYLFDDIKTTISETESLQNNMKEKFKEFAKDYGLIVCGYSGCDRSVMDILELLQRNENYYKNGIYWIFRKNSDVNDEVRKLLRHDRVFYIIEDGFDEAFAQLYVEIMGKETLSLDTTVFSANPNQLIIEKLLKNEYLRSSHNIILKKEYERLQAHNKEDGLIDLLKKIGFFEGIAAQDGLNKRLTDHTLRNLVKIKQLIEQEKYEVAITQLGSYLTDRNKKDEKIAYYNQLLHCHIKMKNLTEVDSVIHKLVSLDNGNPKYFLQKLPLLNEKEEKIKVIEEAIERDPYNHDLYIRKARVLQEIFNRIYDANKRMELSSAILDAYNKSIKRYPSVKNKAWFGLALFIFNNNLQDNSNGYSVDEIISTLEEQDKYNHMLLQLKFDLLGCRDKDYIKYLEELDEAIDKTTNDPYLLKELKIRVFVDKGDYSEATKLLLKVKDSVEEYLYIKFFIDLEADIAVRRDADYAKAVNLLTIQSADDVSKIRSKRIIQYALYANKLDKANEEFSLIEKGLNNDERLEVSSDILFHEKKYEDAIQLNTQREQSLDAYISIVYILLIQERYGEAEDKAKQFLNEHSFHPSLDILILNYELAKKKQGKHIQKERVSKILEHASTNSIKSACYCLLEQYKKAYQALVQELKDNKGFCYQIMVWPIYWQFREQKDYKKLIDDYQEYFDKFDYLENL